MPELDEMDTLEFPCDPEKLPTSSELPLGHLLLTIKSVAREKSKEAQPGEVNSKGLPKVGGKAMVRVQFVVADPEPFLGLPYTHRFILGSDSDPMAKKPMTWERNATLLMKMFEVAKVGGKTFAEYAAAAPEQTVGATVKVEKSRDDRYPDKRIVREFWAPGTRQVKVEAANADLDAALPKVTVSFANND